MHSSFGFILQRMMLDVVCKSITMCKPAARIIWTLEEQLYRQSSEVSYHALPALEQTMRTVAQDDDTVCGVFYAFLLRIKGKQYD